LHIREFQYMEEWSQEWQQRLRFWCIQDVMFWSIGLSYAAFSLFFVMVFLANVTPLDALKWMTSAISSLVQQLLLFPMMVSVMLSFIMLLAIQRRRALQHCGEQIGCEGSARRESAISWRQRSSLIDQSNEYDNGVNGARKDNDEDFAPILPMQVPEAYSHPPQATEKNLRKLSVSSIISVEKSAAEHSDSFHSSSTVGGAPKEKWPMPPETQFCLSVPTVPDSQPPLLL